MRHRASLTLSQQEGLQYEYAVLPKELAMIEFDVKDMTCAHCVGTITRVVKETAPTACVDIDLSTHLVRIDGVSSSDAIERAIREVGYTPVLKS